MCIISIRVDYIYTQVESMASYVRCKARNGRVYVYENRSYWDKEEKKTKHIRTCIGHEDPETGEIVPNRKKGDAARQRGQQADYEGCTDISCGNTLVLDHCARQLGLLESLQSVFPEDWAAILTCAYFLVCSGRALSYVAYWTADHTSPYGRVLTSQAVSELLDRIDAGRQLEFFRAWNAVCIQDTYYAMDVTSISSYSRARNMVEFGYNRDKEKDLPQVNLLMVLGANSGYPIFYRVLPGSLTDVVSLRDTVDAFGLLQLRRIHYCMDKGFYPADNIDKFYDTHSRFVIGVPFSVNRACEAVETHRNTIRNVRNLLTVGNDQVYAATESQKWNGHRFYLHIYFNSAEAEDTLRSFHMRLQHYRSELESGAADLGAISGYARYFSVKETPKRGRRVSYNDKAIEEFEQNRAGWFCLGTNDLKSAAETLTVYRIRDRVEKAFDDLKNEMDMKRLRVHTDTRASGRIFVQFIALILQTYFRSALLEAKWMPGKTTREATKSLDSIRVITRPGKRKALYTALTKTQRELLAVFGIIFPPCV